MASKTLFDCYPPFPEDVPTANLSRIELYKLNAGEKLEASRLFDACRTDGIFLLDLKDDHDGQELQDDFDAIFPIIKQTFDLDLNELLKYEGNPRVDETGYKQLGALKFEPGLRDQCEFYCFRRDDMVDIAPRKMHPETMEIKRHLFENFFIHAQPIIDAIMRTLEDSLELRRSTLSALQPLYQPSRSTVRLICYPPQQPRDRRTALVGHTDVGTITLLYALIGGLQILPAGADHVKKNWLYVKPEPDCVVVNVGDTLTAWTGGLLRSAWHRVLVPPGDQWRHERLSLAYLVRMKNDASRDKLVGGTLSSQSEDEEQAAFSDLEDEEGKDPKTVKIDSSVEPRSDQEAQGL